MNIILATLLLSASLAASPIQWALPGDIVILPQGGVFDSFPFSGSLNEFDFPVVQIYDPNDEPGVDAGLFDLTANAPAGALDVDFDGVPTSANVYEDSSLIPGHVYQLTIGGGEGVEASLNADFFSGSPAPSDPPTDPAPVPEPSQFLSCFAILSVWLFRFKWHPI
jgi:hypothetical protein